MPDATASRASASVPAGEPAPEPRLQCQRAKDARRIVTERARMQNAHDSTLEVLARPWVPGHLRRGATPDAAGQGVDREVAPLQVLLHVGRLDVGQGPGATVGLAARRADVDAATVGHEKLGGQEPATGSQAGAARRRQLGREGRAVAFDHQVHIRRRHPTENVADVAADDPDALAPLRRDPLDRVPQLRPGRLPDRLAGRGVGHRGSVQCTVRLGSPRCQRTHPGPRICSIERVRSSSGSMQ